MPQKRFSRKSTGEETAEEDARDEDAGLGKEEEGLHEEAEAGADQGSGQFFQLEIPEVGVVGEAEDLKSGKDDAEEDEGVGEEEDKRPALVRTPACSRRGD